MAPDDNPEIKGLQEQLAQAEALHERVKARLGQNELAMAELDRATAAVGEMRTGSDRPTLDMETAMQELARIAQAQCATTDSTGEQRWQTAARKQYHKDQALEPVMSWLTNVTEPAPLDPVIDAQADEVVASC